MRQRKAALVIALLVAVHLLLVPAGQAWAFNARCKGAVLMDAESGEVLFSQDPDVRCYPASVTKLMTLLLALEAVKEGRASLDDKVTASENACSYGGSQVWLEPGETFTLREMLLAVSVGSANDASVAVAEHLAGSEEAFVELMNKKARELGAQNTHFTNSHGLHDPQHYTTAADVAKIAYYAVKNVPAVVDFTSIKEHTFRESPKLVLYNTNKLLWWYNGAFGLKTGTTSEGGRSLASGAEREGLRLIGVVLGSDVPNGHFIESMKLLNYGFGQFRWQQFYTAGQQLGEVKVAKGAAERVGARTGDKVGLVVPKGSKAKTEVRINLAPLVEAPVQQGQTVGTVVVERDGREVKRVPLLAATGIPKASVWQETGRVLQYILTAGNFSNK